jgi:hypothetical protein
MGCREAPGRPEDSHGTRSVLQCVSGDPLLGVTRDGDKGFEVIETKRIPIAPGAGLILERSREGRCEERTMSSRGAVQRAGSASFNSEATTVGIDGTAGAVGTPGAEGRAKLVYLVCLVGQI